MRILNLIFLTAANVSGASFDFAEGQFPPGLDLYCTQDVLKNLDQLVESGSPTPQQMLLVKRTKRYIHNMAEIHECRVLKAMFHFTKDCFHNLRNKQLTLLNDIMGGSRRLHMLIPESGIPGSIEKISFTEFNDVLDEVWRRDRVDLVHLLSLARRIKLVLGVDMLRFEGFFSKRTTGIFLEGRR
jgi:hypothetical protein